ncbi:MAG: hypothetical protein P4L81_08410 [Candidatus Pacebacteria bacterium]|nr:hypothetical protein [Candidatus Paceibacterota bacterium]
MRKFFDEYTAELFALPSDINIYIWFFLILTGEHSRWGKIIAAILSIAILPALRVWYLGRHNSR